MNCTEAIEYIHSLEKFGINPGLERINALCSALGNPQRELKVIHVAGTNGKGSTSTMISNILQKSGYKTGLFISPYVSDFRERIQLNGNMIAENELAYCVERVKTAIEKLASENIQPTEFEAITAAAFLYFKEKGCDYAVMEVGLGGRGDSTNVCKSPLVSVIASISYDHTDRLGKTLSEIAFEKAGIIKEGCPVVTSAEAPEALKVIESRAAECKSLYFETCNIPYTVKRQDLDGITFDTVIQGILYENLQITMLGEHQIKNAICALAALDILEEEGEVTLCREDIYRGFASAKQIGRFEVMSQAEERPVVVIDGAHNPDGAKALRKAAETYLSGKKILMVTGILADKDTKGILSEFVKVSGNFIATEPDNPRKLGAEALKKQLEEMGASCQSIPDMESAALAARKIGKNYDAVIYAGSLYMIGKVRGLLTEGRQEK